MRSKLVAQIQVCPQTPVSVDTHNSPSLGTAQGHIQWSHPMVHLWWSVLHATQCLPFCPH